MLSRNCPVYRLTLKFILTYLNYLFLNDLGAATIAMGGVSVVVGGSAVDDSVLRRHGHVVDPDFGHRGRHQRAVGLHMVVALGFHWNFKMVIEF